MIQNTLKIIFVFLACIVALFVSNRCLYGEILQSTHHIVVVTGHSEQATAVKHIRKSSQDIPLKYLHTDSMSLENLLAVNAKSSNSTSDGSGKMMRTQENHVEGTNPNSAHLLHRFRPTVGVSTLHHEDEVSTARPMVSRQEQGNSDVNKMNTNAMLGFWDVMDKSYVEGHSVHPHIGEYICKDIMCSEFLVQEDLSRVDRCLQKFRDKTGGRLMKEVGPTLLPTCHFTNHTSLTTVLISFPGSGNTWVRGLLEKATGICTGSEYCDTGIWFSGSVGEGIHSGRVLVVKTHNPNDYIRRPCTLPSSYGAAILLIRNPYDALVSYYKYQETHKMKKTGPRLNSHIAELEQNMFGNDPNWHGFVSRYQKKWCSTIRDVVLNECHRPLLIVKYENVKRNRTNEVLRMLDFLGVSYKQDNVVQSLRDDVTTFHREHTSTNSDLFTGTQLQSIQREVQELMSELAHTKHGTVAVGMEEYLSPIT